MPGSSLLHRLWSGWGEMAHLGLILNHVGARLLDHGGRRAAACSVERTSCSDGRLGQEPPHCRYDVPSTRSSCRSRAGHSLPASLKPPGPYIRRPCSMLLRWAASEIGWGSLPPATASIW